MTDRLNVTGLDFDQIKNNLKNFLKQQSEFQDYDFEGSGLNVLMDILAYNTHYNAYYLNMAANESFLDSAILRNSVVSHAKKYGYTPRSVSAPRAVVNVTVDSGSSNTGSLTIPRGYTFLSNQIDNRAYSFVAIEDTTVSKTANNFVFENVNIYEGQYVTYNYVHSESSNPKQIFDIRDVDIDTSDVDNDTSDIDIVFGKSANINEFDEVATNAWPDVPIVEGNEYEPVEPRPLPKESRL